MALTECRDSGTADYVETGRSLLQLENKKCDFERGNVLAACGMFNCKQTMW